jgi:HAD superfamily hydrolase (TIGR01459 family)
MDERMGQRMELITGLSRIADDLDLLLCDVWGVIHNGVAAYPAAGEALARFRAKGGQVILVSNAPRPGDDVQKMFAGLGVRRDAWDEIVTSGDVARAFIAARPGVPMRMIGPDRDRSLHAGLDAPRVDMATAEYVMCTGFLDDETETPADYADELDAAAARDLLLVCANPDLVVERGHRLIPCAGAMALAYEERGGRTLYTGKPHAEIYQAALARAAILAGRPIDLGRVACVGDAIRTDVAGADGLGVPALMVLKGIHTAELFGSGGELRVRDLDRWVDAQTHQPRYAIPELVW